MNTSLTGYRRSVWLGIDSSRDILPGLQAGLPADKRRSLNKVGRTLLPLRLIRTLCERKPLRYLTLIAGLFLGVVGYTIYVNLLQPHPDITYPKDKDQFRYRAIGPGISSSRIPLYIVNVLPAMFRDKLPGNGREGCRSLGFVLEEGHNLPVELAERPIGYRPNCAFCHTGTFQDNSLTQPGMPTHELDLEAFQGCLYDCAADKRFNADTLMQYIDQVADLSPTGHMAYKHLIIPFATKPGRN